MSCGLRAHDRSGLRSRSAMPQVAKAAMAPKDQVPQKNGLKKGKGTKPVVFRAFLFDP